MAKENTLSLTKALKRLRIKTLSLKMLEKLIMLEQSAMSPTRAAFSSGARDEQGPGITCRKGSFAVYVGKEAKRYVIPLSYLKHPLFLQLLKKAEEEFGFGSTSGGLQIPCEPAVFDWLLLFISREDETLNVGMMEELIDLCSL